MAKKTRTELSTSAINTNLPDNTQELITPTTERAQLTDERESVVNYKDDLGGTGNAGKFLTVAVDGESLTMVDAPTGDVTGSGVAGQVTIWDDTNNITSKAMLVLDDTFKVLKIIIPSENASGGISIDQQGTTGSGSLVFLDDGVYKAQIVYDVSDGNLTLNSNGDIEITPDGDTVISGGTPIVEHVRITSGGNVGIGTNSPDSLLHLASSFPEIRLEDSDYGTNHYSSIDGNGGSGVLTLSADSSNAAANSAMIFKVDGTEKMRISSGGDVLIGSTSLSGIPLIIEKTTTTGFAIAFFRNNATGGNGLVVDVADNTGTYISDFRVGNSSKMRITSGGNVLIGKTVANNDDVGLWLNPVGTTWITQNNDYCLGLNRKGTDGTIILFTNDQATAGTISVSGTTTAYNTSSDYRLKENVTPITDALSRINQLKPSRFNFIADADRTVDGFIAHEVQDIIPEAISGEKDAMRDEKFELTPRVDEVLDEEGNVITEAVEAVMETRSVPDYQGIDQSKIVPLLTAAIQEQQTIIKSLITRLEALEA